MLAAINWYALLSDLILAIHFTFVLFIIGGFLLIWIGHFAHWPFVRNFRFRMIHLLAMAFVMLESIIGMLCPLTTWENQLRLRAGETQAYSESFMQHWVGRLLFYDVTEQTFTILYALFFLLLLITFWFIPPRRKRRPHLSSS